VIAFGKSSSADNPVLGLSSLHPPISCSVVIVIHPPRSSFCTLIQRSRIPLFPLYFDDIDDTPATRRLYSWLLCIIHRRAPAYSSISTPATTHSADHPDIFNNLHLTVRVRRVSVVSPNQTPLTQTVALVNCDSNRTSIASFTSCSRPLPPLSPPTRLDPARNTTPQLLLPS
jgi:hypothetical protein